FCFFARSGLQFAFSILVNPSRPKNRNLADGESFSTLSTGSAAVPPDNNEGSSILLWTWTFLVKAAFQSSCHNRSKNLISREYPWIVPISRPSKTAKPYSFGVIKPIIPGSPGTKKITSALVNSCSHQLVGRPS